MKLVIDDYVAFLGRQSERFIVKRKDKPDEEFPSNKVTQIIVGRASSISRSAISLAAEHGIDIVFIDWKGYPVSRLYNDQGFAKPLV